WNTAFSQGTEAYSWGNHANYGYLTSYTEADPLFTNSYANSITGIDITNWNTAFSQGTEAYSWGNHANAGYLTTYEEYDPLFSSSWANSITGDDIYNWNQAFYFGSEAYSWGNHLNAGYLHTYDNYVQSLNSFTGEINIVAGTNITVQESENNIIISSTGGGSGITFPYLGYPNCNTDAFTVMNSGTGGCVVGLASNNNVGRLGSQTYGAVGVNGTNGNLGGLGNLLFSVVGINGTTNTVGFLGGQSMGVYANNPLAGSEVALATNDYAIAATKGGFFNRVGGSIGFSILDSNSNNSFTELATREINNHFVGLFSENYENTSISGTSVKLAGYDYALSGTTGNKNFSIGNLNSGLHLEAFWPGYNGFSCTTDLIVGGQNNPETYAMYLKTRKSDTLTFELFSGQFSALFAESHGYLLPTNYASLAGPNYAIRGIYGNKAIIIGNNNYGIRSTAYWPGFDGESCIAEFVIGDQNDTETYAMYLKTRKSEDNIYDLSSGDYSALFARNIFEGVAYTVALCTNSYAAWFEGNVDVNGILSKLGGSFKIDHPQDPENKYLVHSFVESPDMKNIYDGIITLDENGEAVVVLPDYFESLNKDFRYQLTCIGGFANVYIKEKVKNNKFKIAGGTAGLEVSWLVTGIRKDPWAEKNRIQTEPEKADKDKGKYLTPDVYNQPKEKGIYYREDDLQLEKK
ncbi:MAG TPA: hypothetical protein PKY56_11215, partial [Candidatus Kapabacteria bacterium]|nr:hypothetical protein [Candidatus Kapabacteria bacterium]